MGNVYHSWLGLIHKSHVFIWLKRRHFRKTKKSFFGLNEYNVHLWRWMCSPEIQTGGTLRLLSTLTDNTENVSSIVILCKQVWQENSTSLNIHDTGLSLWSCHTPSSLHTTLLFSVHDKTLCESCLLLCLHTFAPFVNWKWLNLPCRLIFMVRYFERTYFSQFAGQCGGLFEHVIYPRVMSEDKRSPFSLMCLRFRVDCVRCWVFRSALINLRGFIFLLISETLREFLLPVNLTWLCGNLDKNCFFSGSWKLHTKLEFLELYTKHCF